MGGAQKPIIRFLLLLFLSNRSNNTALLSALSTLSHKHLLHSEVYQNWGKSFWDNSVMPCIMESYLFATK